MNTEKIVQIIPAPAGIFSEHSTECDGKPYGFRLPVVCLALVEDQCGERYVRPISMDREGCVDFPENIDGFDYLVGEANSL